MGVVQSEPVRRDGRSAPRLSRIGPPAHHGRGLVIGLELTLLAKILFDVKPTIEVLWWSCAIGLLITAVVQLGILFTLLPVGYGTYLSEEALTTGLMGLIAEESLIGQRLGKIGPKQQQPTA